MRIAKIVIEFASDEDPDELSIIDEQQEIHYAVARALINTGLTSSPEQEIVERVEFAIAESL